MGNLKRSREHSKRLITERKQVYKVWCPSCWDMVHYKVSDRMHEFETNGVLARYRMQTATCSVCGAVLNVVDVIDANVRARTEAINGKEP